MNLKRIRFDYDKKYLRIIFQTNFDRIFYDLFSVWLTYLSLEKFDGKWGERNEFKHGIDLGFCILSIHFKIWFFPVVIKIKGPRELQHEKDLIEEKRYNEEMKLRLKKYEKRNNSLISELGHNDTMKWVLEYMKKNTGGSRSVMGDEIFDASLRIMASYNPLAMEFTKDEIDRDRVIYFLDSIKTNMSVLIKNGL